jgi:hypothetical protein
MKPMEAKRSTYFRVGVMIRYFSSSFSKQMEIPAKNQELPRLLMKSSERGEKIEVP